MFEKTLVGSAKDVLALLASSGLLQDAYLAGDTGVATRGVKRDFVDLYFISVEGQGDAPGSWCGDGTRGVVVATVSPGLSLRGMFFMTWQSLRSLPTTGLTEYLHLLKI